LVSRHVVGCVSHSHAVWVQINTNDALLLTLNNNQSEPCNFTTIPSGGDPFLDTTYPYDTRNPTNDNPTAVLDSTTSKELIRNFSATMYLMWSPGPAPSIPVPLGSVSWHWSGDVTFNGSTWIVSSGSGSANAFQTSNSYPTWTGYSDASSRTCN